MSTTLVILRAGPLATIQDEGRVGMLIHGISASGAMDRGAYRAAGALAGNGAGGVEITSAGLDFRVEGDPCRLGYSGGAFTIRHNGAALQWPGMVELVDGDTITVTPGPSGNYGYLRFDADIDVPVLMGSRATSSRVKLGGFDSRALRAGDCIALKQAQPAPAPPMPAPSSGEGLIRFVWGLHADLFSSEVRERLVTSHFTISNRLDRMGVQLDDPDGVFANTASLSLVSDAIVAGDIQIVGEGAPTVLMRDHQPTGGYPRIATVISADLDRFAQLRPGTAVAFAPVTVEHAHQLLRGTK